MESPVPDYLTEALSAVAPDTSGATAQEMTGGVVVDALDEQLHHVHSHPFGHRRVSARQQAARAHRC